MGARAPILFGVNTQMKYNPPPRYWPGKAPTTCGICNGQILDAFTDGKTWRGPWAIMCESCLPSASIAKSNHWGTGLGQHYVRQPDNKWLKTAG